MHQNCEDRPHLQRNRARKSPFCVEPAPAKAGDEPIVFCPLVTAENEVWLGSHYVVFALCDDGNHYTDDDINFFSGTRLVPQAILDLQLRDFNLETRMALFILTSGQIYTPEKAITPLQLLEAIGHYFGMWVDTQQYASDCFRHLRLDLANLIALPPVWLGTVIPPVTTGTQFPVDRVKFYFKPYNGNMSLTTYPVHPKIKVKESAVPAAPTRCV